MCWVNRFGFEFTVVVVLLRVFGCFELFVVLMVAGVVCFLCFAWHCWLSLLGGFINVCWCSAAALVGRLVAA